LVDLVDVIFDLVEGDRKLKGNRGDGEVVAELNCSSKPVLKNLVDVFRSVRNDVFALEVDARVDDFKGDNRSDHNRQPFN
jgi:hypothetical protein